MYCFVFVTSGRLDSRSRPPPVLLRLDTKLTSPPHPTLTSDVTIQVSKQLWVENSHSTVDVGAGEKAHASREFLVAILFRASASFGACTAGETARAATYIPLITQSHLQGSGSSSSVRYPTRPARAPITLELCLRNKTQVYNISSTAAVLCIIEQPSERFPPHTEWRPPRSSITYHWPHRVRTTVPSPYV